MYASVVCATTNVYSIVRINGYIINVTLRPKCLTVSHSHFNDSGSFSQLELPKSEQINEYMNYVVQLFIGPMLFSFKTNKT